MRNVPKSVQNEIIEILDCHEEAEFTKNNKIRHARLIIKLRHKYNFKRKGLGLN